MAYIFKFSILLLLFSCSANEKKIIIAQENDKNIKKTRFFRMLNEIPFVIMFIILVFVIIKPDI